MMCELCGRTVSEGVRIRLEGGVVTACSSCALLGEAVEEPKPARKEKPKTRPAQLAKPEFRVESAYELAQDYGARIKAAREKLGLTQEELGKMVNETHSVIHRMESGRFEPGQDFARKLEGRLKIRLLVPSEEVEAPKRKQEAKDITLGDMVVVRRRK